MRRSAGAILRESRPAMIIRSDWRGDPRKTSAPNRAMSYRLQLIAIISMAQHASPNVTGQMAERRAHCTSFSTLVVRTGISISVSSPIPVSLHHRRSGRRRMYVVGIVLGAPVEHPFSPHVDIADD